MNLLKKVFIWFLLFIFFIFSTNALVLEWDIKLEEANTDSLKISWEAVDGAIGYFVYYDTESHSEDKNYSNTSDDMIEGTGTIIENLDPNTTYYVALKVVDWEWNEWEFSNEYTFSTTGWNSNNLAIEKIKVIDSKNIIVVFNNNIDSTKDVEFKIEEKDNNLNEIAIDNVSVEWNSVFITLNSDLESNKDYTLTVISLTWVNWETIEEWVNWVIDFNTGEIVELNSADTNNSDWETNISTDDNSDLEDNSKTDNASDTNEWNSDTENDWVVNNNSNTSSDVTNWDSTSDTELNSADPETTSLTTTDGTNLSEEEIKKTAELAAKKSEKLPQTGPTEWLLFIAALILAFWITKFRKQA